jgi:hypothetical protein
MDREQNGPMILPDLSAEVLDDGVCVTLLNPYGI